MAERRQEKSLLSPAQVLLSVGLGGVILGGFLFFSQVAAFSDVFDTLVGQVAFWQGAEHSQREVAVADAEVEGSAAVTPGSGQVMGISDEGYFEADSLVFRIATSFEDVLSASVLEVDERLSIAGEVNLSGPVTIANDISATGVDMDLGEGTITASNVVYSLQGENGAVELVAGDGVEIDGLTISNADRGSDQEIFKNIKIGSDTISADDNDDTFTLKEGSGVNLSTSGSTVTFSAENLSGWHSPSSGIISLITSSNKVGIGTANPSSKLELDSGTSGVAGLEFTRLTSASSVGVGGGKVLSVDSGGKVILVSDQTGDAEEILPTANTGGTLFFNGSNWASTTNLYHNDGEVGISTTNPQGRFHLNTNDATKIGAIFQAESSQTANLMEWRNSAGSILSYVDADGVFNGSANVDGTLDPGLTTGQVTFQGANGLAGSNNLFWDNDTGRLGIGTTGPDAFLTLSQNEDSNGIKISGYDDRSNNFGKIEIDKWGEFEIISNHHMVFNSGTSNYNFLDPGSYHNTFRIGSGGSANFAHIGTPEEDGLRLYTNNQSRIAIDTEGKVGVGTTSPTSKLHLDGAVTGKALAIFNETGDQDIFIASSSGTPKFVIDNDGNVGVGISNPQKALHVNNTSGIRLQEPGTARYADLYHSGNKLNLSLTRNFLIQRSQNVSLEIDSAGVQLSESLNVSNGNSGIDNVLFTVGPSGTGAGVQRSSWMKFVGTENGVGDASWAMGSDGEEFGLTYLGSRANLPSEGASLIKVLSSGNIGIGTTSPTSKLHLDGATTGKALAIFNETGDQDIFTASSSGTPQFTIKNDGKVGIGTTNPSSQLELSKTDDSASLRLSRVETDGELESSDVIGGIYFEQNDSIDPGISSAIQAVIETSWAESGLAFFTGRPAQYEERMRISQDGYVGIGISPSNSHTLRTVGSIRSDTGEFYGTRNDAYIDFNFNDNSGGGSISTLLTSRDDLILDFGYNSGKKLFFRNNANQLGALTGTGLLGIGTTSPTSKLHLDGAVTGKALAIFNETGDQDIFTASASGSTKIRISNSGNLLPGTPDTVNIGASENEFGTIWTNTISNRLGTLTLSTSGSGHIDISPYNLTGRIRLNGVTSIGGDPTPDAHLEVSAGGTTGGSIFMLSSDDDADGDLLTVKEDGKVGIGTTSPSNGFDYFNNSKAGYRLHSDNGNYLVSSGNNTTLRAYGSLTIEGPNNGPGAILIQSGNTSGNTVTLNTKSTLGSLLFEINSSEKMRVDSTGNVGIGTTAPTSKLHLDGAVTGKALAIFNETGNQDIFTASSSGTPKFTIKNDGRVGIGTTSPSYKLEVEGEARINVDGSRWIHFDADQFGAAANLYSGSDFNLGTTAFAHLRFYTDSNLRMFIDRSSGDVTINQDLTISGGDITLANSGTVGIGDVKWTFDDTGDDISTLGNVGINTTDQFGSGTGVLALGDAGANPSTTLTNASLFYSSGGEMFVYDSAGNATQISPHDPESGEWIYNSQNLETGKELYIEMEQLTKDIDQILGGGYVWENGQQLYSGQGLFEDGQLTLSSSLSSPTKKLNDKLVGLEERIAALEASQSASTETQFQSGLIETALRFLEQVTFQAKVIFQAQVEFLATTIFREKAVFEDGAVSKGTFTLNPNQAGKAIVLAGSKRVEVEFTNKYHKEPIVTVSAINYDGMYKLTNITSEGFAIELNIPHSEDIHFNWHAFPQEEASVTVSDEPAVAGATDEKAKEDKTSEDDGVLAEPEKNEPEETEASESATDSATVEEQELTEETE